MNEVVAGIYVGGSSAEANKVALKEAGITHILSAALNYEPTYPKDFVYKVISIEDSPEENIMQYFPECNEFIHKCLQGGGKILIHCIAGQSRSSALAAAYIMQERKIGADEALALIKLKRPQIYPNSGFKEQLELYYELDYKVSTDNSLYRHFLISKNSELFAAGGSIDNVVCAADPAKSGNTSNGDYRCKMCRRSLLRDENVLKHSPGAGQLAFTYKKQNRDLIANSSATCSSIFIEPMEWIEGMGDGEILGRIDCPKCSSKLGAFNWAGSQCSCGKWITPSVQIHRNKVDRIVKR